MIRGLFSKEEKTQVNKLIKETSKFLRTCILKHIERSLLETDNMEMILDIKSSNNLCYDFSLDEASIIKFKNYKNDILKIYHRAIIKKAETEIYNSIGNKKLVNMVEALDVNGHDHKISIRDLDDDNEIRYHINTVKTSIRICAATKLGYKIVDMEEITPESLSKNSIYRRDIINILAYDSTDTHYIFTGLGSQEYYTISIKEFGELSTVQIVYKLRDYLLKGI